MACSCAVACVIDPNPRTFTDLRGMVFWQTNAHMNIWRNDPTGHSGAMTQRVIQEHKP